MNKFIAPALIALGLASCTAEDVAPDCLDRSHIVRGVDEYTLFTAIEHDEGVTDYTNLITPQPGVPLGVFQFTFTPQGNVVAIDENVNKLTGAFAVQCNSVNIDFVEDGLGVLVLEQQPNGDFVEEVIIGDGVRMVFVIIKN